MIRHGQSFLPFPAARWAIVAVLVLSTPVALAIPNNWTGNGDWTDVARWSAGHTPAAGEDVTIVSGTVTQAISSLALTSYTLNSGAFHVFNGTNTAINATTVSISGTMTHGVNTDTNGVPGVYADWTPDNRVWISCSNLTLTSTGVINANAKGYEKGYGFSGVYLNGYGPGGGRVAGTNGGAGYGGVGGGYGLTGTTNCGATYGSVTAPEDPGSGGAGRNGCCGDFARNGGRGGGAVRINASGTVTVDGTISVNGDPPDGDQNQGAGSGGSVLITCKAIAGAGVVSTDGNNSNYGGAGGGGRISVVFDQAGQIGQNAVARPTILFSATGGYSTFTGNNGRPGTFSFPTADIFPVPRIGGGVISIAGVTRYDFDSLTITNGLCVFPDGSTVVVSNNLTTGGTRGGIELREGNLQVNGNFTMGGSSYGASYLYSPSSTGLVVNGSLIVRDAGALYYYATNYDLSVFSVASNLIVTNVGKLFIYGGPTNAASPGYSVDVRVGKELAVATNSWIYPYSHEVNGGSIHFQVKDLTLLTPNGGFNAVGKGYKGGNDQIVAGGPQRGYGPGGGVASPSLSSGGGGYGGFGWNYQTLNGTNCGWTYGSTNEPTQPGSGGGGRQNTSDNRMGGWGGGLVWIDVDRLATLNGDINAAGGIPNSDQWQSGGSGGAIYLRIRRLEGTTARLYVNGGSSANLGGGGGGRIAILSTYNNAATQTWTFAVNGGTGSGGKNGLDGTLYFGTLSVPGTLILVK